MRYLWLVLLASVVIGGSTWWFGARDAGPLKLVPDHGIYPAGSRITDEHAFGGFGRCDNFPQNLAERNWGEAGAVSVVALPDEPAAGMPSRFVVRVINRTDGAIGFIACDSCLYLRQEAQDRNGTWHPIELPPLVICGNSFHRVFLDRNQYWEFAARRPSGLFKTRLRFRLEQGGLAPLDAPFRRNPNQHLPLIPTRGGQLIYSNEFEGWINETLFVAETDE